MYMVGEQSLLVGESKAPLLSPNPGCSLSDRTFWTEPIHGDTIISLPSTGAGLLWVWKWKKQWNTVLSATDPNSVVWKKGSYYFLGSGIPMRKERIPRENEGGASAREKKTSRTEKIKEVTASYIQFLWVNFGLRKVISSLLKLTMDFR